MLINMLLDYVQFECIRYMIRNLVCCGLECAGVAQG